MRTITCKWAVPWKGGGTAARLKGEGLGTDHATWLVGRRCVARWRTLLSVCGVVSVAMLYGARGALGPIWGRAWQHREVPSPVRAYPCLCRRTTGVWSMHRRRRGCSKGAVRVQGRPDGDPVLGVGIRCSVCACDVWTLSYGDVGTCGRCLRAPRAPPSTGAGVRRLCGGSSGARGARCCVRRSAARSDGVTDAERLRL